MREPELIIPVRFEFILMSMKAELKQGSRTIERLFAKKAEDRFELFFKLNKEVNMQTKTKALEYILSLFKLRWLSRIPALKAVRIKKFKQDGYKVSAYILKPVKTILLSAVFCSFGIIATAEDLTEPKGPFFYRADKEDKSLYLLGTMHSESLDQLQCRSPIMSFLEDSDLLWSEVSEGIKLQTQAKILADLEESAEPEFNSLSENSKRFLVDTFKRITQTSHSVAVEQLQQANLPSIGLFLLLQCIPPEIIQFIQSQANGMDSVIQKMADSLNIPQNFLDDLQSYSAVFEINIPSLNFTVKDINFTIDDHDQFCKSTEDNLLPLYQTASTFQNLYRMGEIDENSFEDVLKSNYQKSHFYYSLFDKPVPEDKNFKAFKDTVLKNRNQKWIEKIRQSHKDNNSIFIATGLGHLIASDNILDMLKEDGFSIQRMNADCSFNSVL